MNSAIIRNALKPISDLIEGITIPVVSTANALSDSPIYCIPAERRICINKEKMSAINILDKPELLIFVTLHEVRHIEDNSILAELRFDREAIKTMVERGIDITAIDPMDFDSLLDVNDGSRIDRVNQLIKFQNIIHNG